MAEKSNIEWTDATWNPVLGCDKISPGCKNCYAIRTAWRLQHNPNPKIKAAFEGLTVMQGGQPNWTGRVNFVEERLREPLTWSDPRFVFVNSQSDLFHESITDEQIDRIFAVMWLAQRHTFQVLTKRPARMAEYMRGLTWERIREWMNKSADGGEHRPGAYNLSSINGRSSQRRFVIGDKTALRALPLKLPLPNVWLGVSVESPKYKERIGLLRETPAAVRFLSLEPLLEDLGQLDLRGIHWVIAGGESGPGARPMHPDWARSLRDQCLAAGLPFFFKQWGAYAPFADGPRAGDIVVMKNPENPYNRVVDGQKERFEPWNRDLHGSAYGNVSRCDSVMMRPQIKKAAGRLLDGKEHNEYPVPVKAAGA